MKKIISLLLCVALLCGCAATQTPTEPTQEPTRPQVEVPMEQEASVMKYEGVELTYWSLLDEQDPEAAVLLQAAADFRQTTGATVNIRWFSADEDSLIAGLAGDLQADLFEVSGEGLSLNLRSVAMDLTELAADAQYESKSWEVLRNQITGRSGTLNAIAYRPYLYGLYYNRQIFEDLGIESGPDTWQEFLDFCRMLQENGYAGLTIDQEKANLVLELMMERALGWEELKQTVVYSGWRRSEMGSAMIQEAIDFAQAGYLANGTPATFPAGQNRLAQSNATFVAGSNVLCYQVEEDCLSDMSWGVMRFPGDGPGTGLLVDADVLAIHTSCSDPEAAFDFIMLLTTGEYDQLRTDLTVGIPADPNNSSPICDAKICMAQVQPHSPKWFTQENNLLFTRLWNGYYRTGTYFANQLNQLAWMFESEKSVG